MSFHLNFGGILVIGLAFLAGFASGYYERRKRNRQWTEDDE